MEELIEKIIIELSNNYTNIISREKLKEYPNLNWGNNGIGDRWAGKKYNYSTITKKDSKLYSNNQNDYVPLAILQEFRKTYNSKNSGIIGIFVHSKKNILDNSRPIRNDIKKEIIKSNCVVCGSFSSIICDHKNDLYNDRRVLNSQTQKITDFQALCNHCNLQKRQVCKTEKENMKLYSAKNIPSIKSMCNFDIPWEKKVYDINCITTKEDTFWYDPIEFNRKLMIYITYKFLIVDVLNKKNIKKENKISQIPIQLENHEVKIDNKIPEIIQIQLEKAEVKIDNNIPEIIQIQLENPKVEIDNNIPKIIQIQLENPKVEIDNKIPEIIPIQLEKPEFKIDNNKKTKSRCIHIFIKGKNKGEQCTKYTNNGVKCSKHK